MTHFKKYLTTIEEDFKAFGLVLSEGKKTKKTEDETPAPVGLAGGKSDKDADGDDDDTVAKGGDTKEEEAQEEGDEKTVGAVDTDDDTAMEAVENEDSEELSESRRINKKLVKKGGKYVPARVKGHLSSSQKSAKKRENKKFRSSSTGRKVARKLKTGKAKRMAATLRQARKHVHESMEPVERIQALLGEAKQLMETAENIEIPSFDSGDAIKGFAQISLVAGKLAEEFEAIAEEIGEDEYLDLSEMFDALADESAESADSMVEISESEEYEPDEGIVESDFAAMTASLLEGLEIYAELIEDEDDVEEATGDDPEPEDDAEGSGKGEPGGEKKASKELAKDEARDPIKPDLGKGKSDTDDDGDDDDSVAKDECAGDMGMPKTEPKPDDGDDEEPKKETAPKGKAKK